MFEVGDRAMVLTDIVRKDGRSRAFLGDVVEITQVFRTENAQIVAIKFYDYRLPMIDIVLFDGSHVLKELTDGGFKEE
jgi:hypothetical protein